MGTSLLDSTNEYVVDRSVSVVPSTLRRPHAHRPERNLVLPGLPPTPEAASEEAKAVATLGPGSVFLFYILCMSLGYMRMRAL